MITLLSAVKALRSAYQRDVVDLPVSELYPWTFYPDERWRPLAENIRVHGMIHPLLVVRLTGAQWFKRTMFGRKPWKLPLLEAFSGLPAQDASEVLAVRVGCQRFHVAVHAGYELVSCLVFDSVEDVMNVWEHLRAETT